MVKRLVGISGKIASGKTTCSDYLTRTYGYERVSFATPIKHIASWYRDYLLTKNTKKDVAPKLDELYTYLADTLYENHILGYAAYCFMMDRIVEEYEDVDWSIEKSKRWRELLQAIGNGFRDEVQEDTWVSYLTRNLLDDKLYVCDDVRYINEFENMTEAGFTMIRLDISPEEQERRILENYGTINKSSLTHISEVSLDNTTFPYHIDADLPLTQVIHELVTYINHT